MIQDKNGVTSFGTVTSDHLIYDAGRGWSKGGPSENIPLRQVTHAELVTLRHSCLGTFLVLIAIACRVIGLFGTVVAIVPLAVAILLLWGSPLVRVHTADGDVRSIRRLPWTRPEAEWFVAAVNHRIAGVRHASSVQPDLRTQLALLGAGDTPAGPCHVASSRRNPVR